MALTLDSIYKPVNEFFLDLYKTDAAAPVFFKFDKYGSIISDGDFMDVSNQNNNGLILERFSDLVNRLPLEDADGLNILFASDTIDDIYFYKLLNASIPFAKNNDPNKDDIISAASKIIADAKNEFEKSSLARQGVPALFRASYAAPGNWYDSTKNEIWTTHVFQAGETVTTAPAQNQKSQLWKLKVDDAILKNVLSIKSTDTVQPAQLYQRVLLMKTNPKPGIIENMKPQAVKPVMVAAPAGRVSATAVRDHRTDGDNTVIRDHRIQPQSAGNFTIHNSLQTTISRLNLKQRYFVNQYIKTNAPTQPATTNSIKISFDYCKVDIRRPWLFNTFLNNNSWYIPGIKKGELSTPDANADISVLPIGFIAIKNLIIEANWSDTDIINSKNATDFGPFEVDSEIVNNKLSHGGIQIIGWLLQQMPDLPPNDPPE